MCRLIERWTIFYFCMYFVFCESGIIATTKENFKKNKASVRMSLFQLDDVMLKLLFARSMNNSFHKQEPVL